VGLLCCAGAATSSDPFLFRWRQSTPATWGGVGCRRQAGGRVVGRLMAAGIWRGLPTAAADLQAASFP